MNNENIMREMVKELRSMYPGFAHTMSYSQVTNTYQLTVYRNAAKLKTLVLNPSTPVNETWELIGKWMRPLVKGMQRG